ncbi:MAG: hypothetical protein H7843_09775 [Nitrospirota bacterium]
MVVAAVAAQEAFSVVLEEALAVRAAYLVYRYVLVVVVTVVLVVEVVSSVSGYAS